MVPGDLHFPDGPRAELDEALEDLIDRARHVAEVQGRLRGLLKANQLIHAALTRSDVLTAATTAAVDLVGARYGALGVMVPSGDVLDFVPVGAPAGAEAAIGRAPSGKGMLGAVFRAETPIRLEHIADDPRAVGFPPGHPVFDSFLGVPIRVRGSMYGALYVGGKRTGAFTDDDQELLSSLAGSAGTAIENGILYDETVRARQWAAAATAVSTAILAGRSDEALPLVAESLVELLQADIVVVLLPRGDHELVVEVARGPSAEHVEGIVVPDPVDRLLSGDESATALFETLGAVASARERSVSERSRITSLAVPLVAESATLGVLVIGRADILHPFAAQDVDLVTDFAQHATFAIQILRHRERQEMLDLADDRSRIARDLHDRVIQRLFASGLDLQAAASHAETPAIRARIEGHIENLDEAIAEIRTVIFALQPPKPHQEPSLKHRIVDLVAEMSPLLPETPHLTLRGPLDLAVDATLADDLVAVCREALMNAVRHARATHVDVTVQAGTDSATVTVSDDGVGVGATTRRSGLENLRARAVRRGGTFDLGEPERGGTTVTWTAPAGSATVRDGPGSGARPV